MKPAKLRGDDHETAITTDALALLADVVVAAAHWESARDWEEYAEANGGMEALEAALIAAVRRWEQWRE